MESDSRRRKKCGCFQSESAGGWVEHPPDIAIVEQPMTALDVMVQYQIIGLLRHLSGRTGMALRFITRGAYHRGPADDGDRQGEEAGTQRLGPSPLRRRGGSFNLYRNA
jgi:hypothetical protein